MSRLRRDTAATKCLQMAPCLEHTLFGGVNGNAPSALLVDRDGGQGRRTELALENGDVSKRCAHSIAHGADTFGARRCTYVRKIVEQAKSVGEAHLALPQQVRDFDDVLERCTLLVDRDGGRACDCSGAMPSLLCVGIDVRKMLIGTLAHENLDERSVHFDGTLRDIRVLGRPCDGGEHVLQSAQMKLRHGR